MFEFPSWLYLTTLLACCTCGGGTEATTEPTNTNRGATSSSARNTPEVALPNARGTAPLPKDGRTIVVGGARGAVGGGDASGPPIIHADGALPFAKVTETLSGLATTNPDIVHLAARSGPEAVSVVLRPPTDSS